MKEENEEERDLELWEKIEAESESSETIEQERLFDSYVCDLLSSLSSCREI